MTLRPRLIAVPAALAAAAAVLVPGLAQPPTAGSADGTISTFAGTVPGFVNGPPDVAQLRTPEDVAPNPASGQYQGTLIADTGNNAIRLFDTSNTIVTKAGDGTDGFGGDGGDATNAQLSRPSAVAALPDGSFLIADTGNNRIRRVDVATGNISTVAGTGTQGVAGDGGPATAAQLDAPTDVVPVPGGGYFVADSGNGRVRFVSASGTITTFAGTTPGYSGDGGKAAAAQLSQPRKLSLAPDGAVLIADTGNARVRRVDAGGTITTVAGGQPGFAGDGGQAKSAALSQPSDVIPLSNGGFLIADTGNNRVRRVTPLGTIFTIAGSTAGSGGDGGPASQAQLNQPEALTRTPNGGVIITDTANSRVRVTTDTGQLPDPKLTKSIGVVPLGAGISVQPTGAPAPIALREPDLAPNGSAFNASQATVQVTLQASTSGDKAQMKFAEGAFRLKQNTGTRPITDVTLNGPLTCTSGHAHAARAGAASLQARSAARKRNRRVWGRGKGRFRTRGRYASALVRGTWWLTEDRCDGTLVKVREGKVEVRDLAKRKTVFVTKGKFYFARKPVPKRRAQR